MLSSLKRSHKGVSEITGGIIMLGVVGMVAAGILTLGLSSITDFQTFLLDVSITDQSLKESFIVEYVHFSTDSSGDVNIWVRNVGLNDVTIESIAITNIDTQELIKLKDDTNYKINARDMELIIINTSFDFSTSTYSDASYRISLVTTRGNIYETEARPYNT